MNLILQYPIFGSEISCPHCRQTIPALTLTDTYLCSRHGAFEANPKTEELVHLPSGRCWRRWEVSSLPVRCRTGLISNRPAKVGLLYNEPLRNSTETCKVSIVLTPGLPPWMSSLHQKVQLFFRACNNNKKTPIPAQTLGSSYHSRVGGAPEFGFC